MKEKIKNYLINEITIANDNFKKICNDEVFEDEKLREIFFLIEYDENRINEIFKNAILTDKQIGDLFYLLEMNKLSAVVIIKFLILKCNLNFNHNEFSNKKPRFDEQILKLKQNFDNVQRYTKEQDYRDIPRRDLDLLYGFREYLTRCKFCTDDEIRDLLSIIEINKLPKMPKEWKQLNREWRENIANDLKLFMEQNKNNLSNYDAEEHNKKFWETVKRANQYKPKKL